MSTAHENTESIFQLFRALKLDISDAIKDLFPFLEVLRDNNVISDRQYDHFQESCGNETAVQKRVYNVLRELEEKNDLEALGLLFCKQNMKAYPDLEPIFERFKKVLPQDELWSEEIDRRDPNSQLSVEQGPGVSCSQESLTWSPSGPSSSNGWRSNDGGNTTLTQQTQTENRQFSIPQIHKEDLYEVVHVKKDTTGDDIDGRQRLQAARLPGPGSEPEESCELKVQLSDRDAGLEPHIPLPCSNEKLPRHGIKIFPCPVNLVNLKQENSSVFLSSEHQTHTRTDHNQASEVIDLTRDNSDDGPRCTEESTSVTCQSREDTQRARQAVGICSQEPKNFRNPPTSINIHRRRDMSDTKSSRTRKRQRRTRHTTYAENNSTSGKHSQKKEKEKQNWKICNSNIKMPVLTIWKKAYTRKRINSSSQRRRKRGLTDPRQSNVDFNCPELPVTCGTAEGTLYVEKFKKGTHKKSIRSDNEEWFTPREFEIRGNLERSKNWKKSIHCYEWTLKVLIEKELLPNPQKKKEKNKYVPDPPKKKIKLENSQQCTVCSQGWNLYPCDSCGKFYHEECHIPPVEDKSGPWSCVFCKIKDQAKFQENQAFHKESEVLKRKMLPEEQLKCELLLLTVYQEPKCCFFICKPKQSKEDFPDLKKHMWLDKVKNKLNKKAYHSVKHFVADMRLIFQNHSIFYKDQRFSNLGDTIRKVFEKNFKIFFQSRKQGNNFNHELTLQWSATRRITYKDGNI